MINGGVGGRRSGGQKPDGRLKRPSRTGSYSHGPVRDIFGHSVNIILKDDMKGKRRGNRDNLKLEGLYIYTKLLPSLELLVLVSYCLQLEVAANLPLKFDRCRQTRNHKRHDSQRQNYIAFNQNQ